MCTVHRRRDRSVIRTHRGPRDQSRSRREGCMHRDNKSTPCQSESHARRTTWLALTNGWKTNPRIRISSRPAVEPRRRGAAGEPDRPVGVRRGTHGERRPGRLGGLLQQRLAAEEGGRRPLPIPGERRDGGGGGRGGGDECHCARKLCGVGERWGCVVAGERCAAV